MLFANFRGLDTQSRLRLSSASFTSPICVFLRAPRASGALEPSAPELFRQRARNASPGRDGGLVRFLSCRSLRLAPAQRLALLHFEHLFLKNGPPAALGIGYRSRPRERGGELVDVCPRRLSEAFEQETFPRGQGATHAVIETRKARHANLEPSRVERNATELAASLVQPSAPSGSAAPLLGREHQARVRTRLQPRLSLGKGEGGIWRRLIAGQK
jgi:hypothetical protein